VLSLPLILVCASYVGEVEIVIFHQYVFLTRSASQKQAFFKFVPLLFGLPLLAAIVLVYRLNAKLKARQAEKSAKDVIDNSVVDELTAEEDRKKAKTQEKLAKKERKANEKLRQRIKEEKKNFSNTAVKAKSRKDEDDDEVDNLLTFAKGSREKKK